MEKNARKILIAAVLLLLAVVFALPIADLAARPASHQALIASLDTKVETVLKLTSSSTIASVGISAIPGDTATPIAGKLADLSLYFLLILCVLYTEKYMLSIIGLAAFRVLIPCACLAGMVSLLEGREGFRRLAGKLAVLALALYIAIPLSLSVSDMIYRNYEAAIANTVVEAEELSEETSQLANADANLVSAILNKLSESAISLSGKAAHILSRYVETVAVLIVTACIMPLLGLAFILWIIKMFTGSDAFAGMLLEPAFKKHRRPKQPEEGK